jgi:hypothetical protein
VLSKEVYIPPLAAKILVFHYISSNGFGFPKAKSYSLCSSSSFFPKFVFDLRHGWLSSFPKFDFLRYMCGFLLFRNLTWPSVMAGLLRFEIRPRAVLCVVSFFPPKVDIRSCYVSSFPKVYRNSFRGSSFFVLKIDIWFRMAGLCLSCWNWTLRSAMCGFFLVSGIRLRPLLWLPSSFVSEIRPGNLLCGLFLPTRNWILETAMSLLFRKVTETAIMDLLASFQKNDTWLWMAVFSSLPKFNLGLCNVWSLPSFGDTMRIRLMASLLPLSRILFLSRSRLFFPPKIKLLSCHVWRLLPLQKSYIQATMAGFLGLEVQTLPYHVWSFSCPSKTRCVALLCVASSSQD